MAIYFIQAGVDGPIKIGLSDDPPFRLIQLQVSHWQSLRLLAVQDGDASHEAALHERFASAYIRGEWHWPVPELLGLIGELQRAAASLSKSPSKPPKLGMTLNDYRKSLGLSASQLGATLGVSHSTVLRWEAGVLTPSRGAIARIIEVTGGQVQPNDLFSPAPADAI